MPNFKVSAVITLKGTPSDPVTDAYGMTTTSYDAGEGLVRKTFDLVLHCEVSVEEFMKYWLREQHVHARQTDSGVKMFSGWARGEGDKTFIFNNTNRQGKDISVQVCKVAK